MRGLNLLLVGAAFLLLSGKSRGGSPLAGTLASPSIGEPWFIEKGGGLDIPLVGTPPEVPTSNEPPLPSNNGYYTLNARSMSGSGPWLVSNLYWTSGVGGDAYGYPLKSVKVTEGIVTVLSRYGGYAY